MAEIRLENVVRQFKGSPPTARGTIGQEAERDAALNGVDLTVADGETCVIVGPSGCGKSTLLRVIAGLDTEYTGAVYYNGREMRDVSPAERNIGMVFQNYALYPHFPGHGNLSFTFWVRKAPDAEAEERIRATAELMGYGFHELMQRKPGTLSGGQQQRLAIARALVRRPELFLLDEPLSSLDAKLRNQTRIEIKRLLRRFAITTLYVTHDQEEAMALADRLAVMRDGRIEQVGTATELRNRPVNTFVAGFFGAYPMNLLTGIATGIATGIGVQVGANATLDLSEHAQIAAGEELTVGAPPDELRLAWGSAAARITSSGTEPYLPGVIESVEPDFARRVQYARVSSAQGLLTVLEPNNEPLAPGEQVVVLLPASPPHLFASKSGERL
jgi:ABC-type sugar transport system ATPase subunit